MPYEAQRIKDLGRYPMPDKEKVGLPRGPIKWLQIECNTPLHVVGAKVERHPVGAQIPYLVEEDCSCPVPATHDATIAALEVQEMQAEAKRAKEERLRRFQEDLQKRVAQRKKAAAEEEASRVQHCVSYKPDIWSMSGTPRFKDDLSPKSGGRSPLSERTNDVSMGADQWEFLADEGGPSAVFEALEEGAEGAGEEGLAEDEDVDLRPRPRPRIVREAEQLPPGPVRYRAVIEAEAAEERLRVAQRREMEERLAAADMHELRKSQEERIDALNKERAERSEAIAQLAARQRAATEAQAAATMELRAQEMERTRNMKKSRYNTALHVRLQAKVEHLGITLPPLCGCPHGVPVLDEAYPFHCANNCVLYHNVDLYSTMLAHVLHTYGVLE